MSIDKIRVQMLGRFCIGAGDREIDNSGDRSHKVWLLLAYMIYDRDRAITQEDLIRLLWGEEESSSNPLNALKTMFHRVRTTLNQLDSSAGHELIVRRGQLRVEYGDPSGTRCGGIRCAVPLRRRGAR